MKVLVSIVTCVLVTGLSGCGGGDGVGLDENGNTVDNTTPVSALTPTLASIQENIFTPTCATAGCHVPGTAAFGLRLDEEGLSGQLLVNVASAEVPSLMRVNPFDPDNSFIVQKIEGSATAGGRMPLNRTPLSTEQIQAIRDWIADGALTTSSLSTTAVGEVIDLASVQRDVFNPRCVSCHSGIAPPADLNLEEGRSYSNLVNTRQFPSDPASPIRVIPGDADNSYLIRKLEGSLNEGEGVRMPLSQATLSSVQINKLRQWINKGALPSADTNKKPGVQNEK